MLSISKPHRERPGERATGRHGGLAFPGMRNARTKKDDNIQEKMKLGDNS